jgi:hypothetical protein
MRSSRAEDRTAGNDPGAEYDGFRFTAVGAALMSPVILMRQGIRLSRSSARKRPLPMVTARGPHVISRPTYNRTPNSVAPGKKTLLAADERGLTPIEPTSSVLSALIGVHRRPKKPSSRRGVKLILIPWDQDSRSLELRDSLPAG